MISYGQVVLFSKNKSRLANYLCELLDLEMEILTDSIKIGNDALNFLIIERPKLATPVSNMIVDLYVDSVDVLMHLHKKIEFLNYRNSTEISGMEKIEQMKLPEVIDLNEVKFFFMTDTDGRRWKISYISQA